MVLFDTDCNVRDIEYFLIDSEVKKKMWMENYIHKKHFRHSKKASKAEALVIPSQELIVGLEGEEKSEDDILEELQEIEHVNYEDAKKIFSMCKSYKRKGIRDFNIL
ncbi:hypothetical protein FZ989_02205 [Clostridium perfringens]|nr:hypothetical protein [Clostridium perfringens]